MKIKIKDLKYISTDTSISNYLAELGDTLDEPKTILDAINAIIRGDRNKKLITTADTFDVKNFFVVKTNDGACILDQLIDNYGYYVLTNPKFGDVLVREDNIDITEELEDIFYKYDIKKLIRSNDKQTTVMLMEDGTKHITRKDPTDRNDVEKAVMVLLLKNAGYNIKDVYKIIDSVR